MKRLVILHGSARKGIGWRATRVFLDELNRLEPVEVREVFLSRETPDLCTGCYRCFLEGENRCPHHGTIGPVVEAMDGADGLVLVTPVYALEMSGAMKTFMDHLAYCFVNHRPRFYGKQAVVIATTAGAGTGGVLKSLKRILRFWGIPRVHGVGIRGMASGWEEMAPANRDRATRRLTKAARAFHRGLTAEKQPTPRLSQHMMFAASKALVGTLEPDHPDRTYWEAKGWTEKSAVTFQPETDVGPGRRLLSAGIGMLLGRLTPVKGPEKTSEDGH